MQQRSFKQNRAQRKFEPRGFKYVSLTCSLLFLTVMPVLAALEIIPAWIAATYVGFSALSFLAYGYDKSKARRGIWRTAEATLHTLDLFGGWPGGLAGQQVYRHKTRKLKFQIVFWITVIAHIAYWAWAVSLQKVPTFSDTKRLLNLSRNNPQPATRADTQSRRAVTQAASRS